MSREPLLRWVVAEAGQTLGARLDALNLAPTLVASGVVFVNHERVKASERYLKAGDVVEVFLSRTPSVRCRIVEQRGALIAVDKPAELASEPTLAGEDSVAQQLSELTGRPVHVLSRLDVGVSGLLLASTSPAATAHVDELRAQGRYHRQYLAIVTGHPAASQGSWTMPVLKGRKWLASSTHFEVLERIEHAGSPERLSLLLLAPVTGRTHQLRQHTAESRMPILGDRRYGGPSRLVTATGKVLSLDRIMLHSTRLQLTDVDALPWVATLPPSGELLDVWTSVGGSRELATSAHQRAFLPTANTK